MKPLFNLTLFVISWLVLSPFTCYLTRGRNHSNHIRCIDTERDALLQFKHGITKDTCGLLTSWGSHTDCCKWHGVVCNNLTSHVVKLTLAGCYAGWLEGKVSPSLGELKHLKHLNLRHNNFFGKIPHQLGNLSKLTTLDLGAAYINNGVQVQSLSWISRLTLLRYLDLSYANLSQVTNWITIVNNLPSLRVLSLDSCDLSNEIPSSISYVNCSTTLQSISFFENHFKGSSIFQWLFNLPRITTQLVHLDLSYNDFEGPIPSEIGNLHSLSYLDLSENAFQGSVLEMISKLCNLKQLHLENNNFTDELSDVIYSLLKCSNKALLVLDLSYNRFRGEIPDNIGSLSSLRELYLTANQHKGEISPGIRQLTMLEVLDVSSNSLEGTLTHTFFSNLVHLRVLILSDNPRLVIRIEENWIPPFKLDAILLRSCELGPRFPKWLKFQTTFSWLDVSNTRISGSIPDAFWNSLPFNLEYLNLSYNQFYGILPNLPHVPNALTIDLSSNRFEGVLPSGFANTTFLYLNDNRFSNFSNLLCPKTDSNLEKLDLSNNLFYGELPDCWMHFSQLQSLHLENNKLVGRIPNSIGTLLNLKILHLRNNSFSGPFPVAFERLPSLMILNLGYNLLSGSIPPRIGDACQRLGALILHKNHFMGEIPESICQLKNLQILDLASNYISGVIPSCIGNFMEMTEAIGKLGLEFDSELYSVNEHYGVETKSETVIVSWKREEQKFNEGIRFVKYINFSGNRLTGIIPDGISILNGLESLDLSNNKLSGNIPFEIGNLTALELLDLSNNHLSGEIPVSLAKVTYLGTLDVSNNNLSGQIPVSTQLQGFDASQYAGNPRLCGAPLPSCSKDRAPTNVPNGDNTGGQNKDNNFVFFLGLYISVVLGFIVGFWGVCGTLIIKTSWRHAYFRFLDNIKEKIM